MILRQTTIPTVSFYSMEKNSVSIVLNIIFWFSQKNAGHTEILFVGELLLQLNNKPRSLSTHTINKQTVHSCLLDSRRLARYTTCVSVCVFAPRGLIVFYLSETLLRNKSLLKVTCCMCVCRFAPVFGNTS